MLDFYEKRATIILDRRKTGVMPESKYSISGIKNGISILFFYHEGRMELPNNELPINLDEQITSIKKYVVFRQKKRMRDYLQYAGYFRVSRYGKYLLSFVGNLGSKPKQDMLFQLYEFDVELRTVLELYCDKVEIRFKSAVSNAVSIKTQDAGFYLEAGMITVFGCGQHLLILILERLLCCILIYGEICERKFYAMHIRRKNIKKKQRSKWIHGLTQ